MQKDSVTVEVYGCPLPLFNRLASDSSDEEKIACVIAEVCADKVLCERDTEGKREREREQVLLLR